MHTGWILHGEILHISDVNVETGTKFFYPIYTLADMKLLNQIFIKVRVWNT